jgi:hypothetical protein
MAYVYIPNDEPEEISQDEAEAETEAEPAQDASVNEIVPETAPETVPETVPQANGSEAETSSLPEATGLEEGDVEVQEDELAWASETFAKAVKEQKDARACIIYYVGSEDTELQKMQALIDRGKSQLVEKYGLKANDIITIYGGYKEYASVDLWVAPLEDSLPVPTPQEKRPEPPEEVMKVQ